MCPCTDVGVPCINKFLHGKTFSLKLLNDFMSLAQEPLLWRKPLCSLLEMFCLLFCRTIQSSKTDRKSQSQEKSVMVFGQSKVHLRERSKPVFTAIFSCEQMFSNYPSQLGRKRVKKGKQERKKGKKEERTKERSKKLESNTFDLLPRFGAVRFAFKPVCR